MATWVKIIYERNTYAIDLDRVSAFAIAPNGNITFWLPNSSIPIILNPQRDSDSHKRLQSYIRDRTGYAVGSHWIEFAYDRNQYLVDLNCISAFRCDPNSKKITFWLPDSTTDIILHPQANPDAYQKVLDYIEKTTGDMLES